MPTLTVNIETTEPVEIIHDVLRREIHATLAFRDASGALVLRPSIVLRDGTSQVYAGGPATKETPTAYTDARAALLAAPDVDSKKAALLAELDARGFLTATRPPAAPPAPVDPSPPSVLPSHLATGGGRP